MNSELSEKLHRVYTKAVYAVTHEKPCEVEPDEFRALLQFFVLVNINQTAIGVGLLPNETANPPQGLLDALSGSLVKVQEKIQTASEHMKERYGNGSGKPN